MHETLKSHNGPAFVEDARQTIRENCRKSLFYLCANALYKNPDTGLIGMDVHSKLHYEMCYHWQHRRMRRFTQWLGPRGHLKTWTWTVGGSIFEHLNAINTRYLIINATFGKASDILKEIKAEWENNEMLRWIFPEMVHDLAPTSVRRRAKWTDERLDYPNSIRVGAKEGSLEIMGVLSSMVTKHYDFFHFDDPVNDLNVTNAEMREKVWKWRQAAKGLQVPGRISRWRFQGTNWHDLDMFQRHKKIELKRRAAGKPPRMLFYSRACLEDENGQPSMDGEPIWPERYSKEELQELRQEVGDYLFFCNWMNDPVPAGEAMFNFDDMQFCDEKDIPFEHSNFAAIDLATEGGNDYTVITVASFDTAERMYVRYMYRERGVSPLDLVHLIGALVKQYKIKRVAIETVGFQETVIEYYKRWASDTGIWIPFEEMKRGKSKKFWRIQGIQPRIQKGDMFIVRTLPQLEAIEEEVSRYPYGANDDILDTLADLEKVYYRPSGEDAVMLPGRGTFAGYHGLPWEEEYEGSLDGPVVSWR